MALDLSALDESVHPGPSAAAGCVAYAPPSSFEEDPDNPRFEWDPDEFAALVENVRVHGILQPLVVRRQGNGRLRIRFGARRFRAVVQLGLTEIPYGDRGSASARRLCAGGGKRATHRAAAA